MGHVWAQVCVVALLLTTSMPAVLGSFSVPQGLHKLYDPFHRAAHTQHPHKPAQPSISQGRWTGTSRTSLNPSSVSASSSAAPAALAAPSVYPRGDCVTQCSRDPAARMAHCLADPAAGIPATRCQAVADPTETQSCPSLRFPDAFITEAYCMPRFTQDCTHPDNFGCAKRCVLFLIISFHCVTDAFFDHNQTFNPGCSACNMCWDKSGDSRPAAQQAPYAVVWARGPSGAMFKRHWLVLPKRPCVGIESSSPGCTDAQGEFIWSNAYHEAQRLGFTYVGGEPSWALWMNAPNRRGVHQMHIHIAGFEQHRSTPDVPLQNWLVRRMAAATNVSRDPAAPTCVLGEGFYNRAAFSSTPLKRPPKDWARAYMVYVPSTDPSADLGTIIKPFELGRQLAAASDLPGHSYGLVIMPSTFVGRQQQQGQQEQEQQRHQQQQQGSQQQQGHHNQPQGHHHDQQQQQTQQGLLVAAVWSTSDSEQLDETELPGDPIRYSHTCHQYIGTGNSGSSSGSSNNSSSGSSNGSGGGGSSSGGGGGGSSSGGGGGSSSSNSASGSRGSRSSSV